MNNNMKDPPLQQQHQSWAWDAAAAAASGSINGSRKSNSNSISSNVNSNNIGIHTSSNDQRKHPQKGRTDTGTGNNTGGFNRRNLAMLQRMEEVATVWLHILVQQQEQLLQQLLQQHMHLSTDEFRCSIVDFCTNTLQQLLCEGGFKGYTTPSPVLYQLSPLPSLQDLPCMVVMLKHWYTCLLSRCQYEHAVMIDMGMSASNHTHNCPGSTQEKLALASAVSKQKAHVHSCKLQVRQWLGFHVPSFTSTSTAADDTCSDTFTDTGTVTASKSDEQQLQQREQIATATPKYVALWMQQLQNKTMTPSLYSPVKSSHTLRFIPDRQQQQQQNEKHNGSSRMPSPTDVMMFDTGASASVSKHHAGDAAGDAAAAAAAGSRAAANQEKNQQWGNGEDKKPAAAITQHLSRGNFKRQHVIQLQAAEQQQQRAEKEDHMRGLIVSLYHASKCTTNNNRNESTNNPCSIYEGCASVKALWQHICDDTITCSTTSTGTTTTSCCTFGNWCSDAKEALQHYGKCKKASCSICGPVLQFLPTVKRDITNAAVAAKRHAEALEEAILQVAAELAEASSPMKSPTSTTPATTEKSPLSSALGSSSKCDNGSPRKRQAATPLNPIIGSCSGGPLKKRSFPPPSNGSKPMPKA